MIDGGDVGLGLDTDFGGTGPGTAVDLALGHELQVAGILGGLELGHLLGGGVLELAGGSCRAPNI